MKDFYLGSNFYNSWFYNSWENENI